MTRPADETALYEAVYSGKAAGSPPEYQADRERIKGWVDRLWSNGWAITPAGEDATRGGTPAWLDLLIKRADLEGETVDGLVRSLLDGSGEAHDIEDCDRRIADLAAILERNDIEVPEWV